MYLIMDVTGLLLAYCNAMKDTQLPQAHPMKYRISVREQSWWYNMLLFSNGSSGFGSNLWVYRSGW